MLFRSDDDIASQLWSKLGGPAIVTKWAARIGLSGTRPLADPGRWGDTRLTASSMVKIYNYLLDKALAAHRAIILAAWSCCRPGRTLHTTGLLGKNSERIVVVLTSFPESVSYSTATREVSDAVKVLLR
jgi:hypothetical protein